MREHDPEYGRIASWVDDRLRDPAASQAVHELEQMLVAVSSDGRALSWDSIRQLEERCRSLGLLWDDGRKPSDEKVAEVVQELIDAASNLQRGVSKPRLIADKHLRYIETIMND